MTPATPETLGLFSELEDVFLDMMNEAKRLNEICPDPVRYARVMADIDRLLQIERRWKEQAERDNA